MELTKRDAETRAAWDQQSRLRMTRLLVEAIGGDDDALEELVELHREKAKLIPSGPSPDYQVAAVKDLVAHIREMPETTRSLIAVGMREAIRLINLASREEGC